MDRNGLGEERSEVEAKLFKSEASLLHTLHGRNNKKDGGGTCTDIHTSPFKLREYSFGDA